MNIRRSRVGGFTLMELMIAVAIVGILAAIALPSYESYLVKGNRRAAQAFMLDVVNKERQYLLDARAYLAVANNAGFSGLGLAVPNELTPLYDFSVEVASSPIGFTVKADPKSGSRQFSDGSLSVTDTGVKSPAGKW